MKSIEEVLGKVEVVRHDYDTIWEAKCPLHEDEQGELVIAQDQNNGNILVQCRGGCSEEKLNRYFGLDEPDWSDTTIWQFDPLMRNFQSLSAFEEEETAWLFEGWVPEGQITLMAADGGVGKTTLWVNLVAAVSAGKPGILDGYGVIREPGKALILTTEDSIRRKLRKKLRIAGADMDNVFAPDFAKDKNGSLMAALNFGSGTLNEIIRRIKPTLCVFDPVQGFIPPEVNMGSRNAMRQCMAPLISLGEETGTTFLVVCHSNKRKGAYGRDRIADSADLWDISRSVLMLGYTEDDGVRYLSNEKNNYALHQDTVLFSINQNGLVEKQGTTSKTDRDFMLEAANRKETTKEAPKRDDCKQFILDTLDEHNGSIPVKELEEKARAFDYGIKTLRTAKEELKASGQIDIVQKGSGRNGSKSWHVVYVETFVDVTGEEPLPWEQMDMAETEASANRGKTGI